MPTVLRIDGLRLVIWPNDHGPPHVHAFTAEAEAKIELGRAGRYPRVIENRRMGSGPLAKALNTVFQHEAMLIEEWRRIHGRVDP